MSSQLNFTRIIFGSPLLRSPWKTHLKRRRPLVFSGVLLLLFGILSGQAEAQTVKSFQLCGDADGIGWSWGIEMNMDRASDTVEGFKGDCEDLRTAFRDSINQNRDAQRLGIRVQFRDCRVGSICRPPYEEFTPCCFVIIAPRIFRLFVNDIELDPFDKKTRCEVTGNPEGCEFNPMIMEVEN